MTGTKHTQLPFYIADAYRADRSKYYEIYNNPDIDGFDLLCEIEKKEIAEFIVKACNNHYKLLESLDWAISIFTQLEDAKLMYFDPHIPDKFREIAKARQAIKDAS